jgi:serine/threonine-protein kinase RsbW
VNAVTTRVGMFPSRLDEWRHARAFIDEFCTGAGVSREAMLRANLVVEELFLNTVKHGHNGGSEAPVWVTMVASEGKISLTYEDFAPPFNPFARATRELLETLAATGREGGLGVLLAQGLTATADYAYVYGRNRIRLTLV